MKTRNLWSKALKKLSSTKNTTKELRRNAFKSIHIRNKYAHGKLGFVNNEPFLTYDNEDGGEVSSLSNTLLLTKASQK
jgi:hypothetical protein